MEFLMACIVGIGLSAACGFRVFVPMLGTGIAAYSGHLELAESFQWLQHPATIAALGLATALEIGAYYVPWLDNLMDSIAAPAAVTAGTIMTASMVGGDFSPLLKWSLALIAGGGAAGVVQTATTLIRGTSSATTGGLANPVVSTGELAAASGITLMAVIAPIFVAIVLLIIAVWIVRILLRRKKNKELVIADTNSNEIDPSS